MYVREKERSPKSYMPIALCLAEKSFAPVDPFSRQFYEMATEQ